MPSPKDIRQMVGQMFLVGFDGLAVPADFRKNMAAYHLGGVIYFRRNVESPKQIAELSNELQFGCRPAGDPALFISIDHEGGKVNRLSKPFTKFPNQDHLGELGSPKIGFEFGSVLGRELKAVGINIDFAPVVDVNSNPKNPVIGERSFSDDPEVCGRMGSAVCRGIQKTGVMAVAKHFPGHGDTNEDSHFTLPTVDRTREQLESLELIPFRRVVRSRVGGVMTAHMMNPKLDPELPATLSAPTLKILRDDLRFSRIIFSDDMEMKAISDHYGADEAAVLAVAAGCDVLIYRGDEGYPVGPFEAVVKAVESKQIPATLIEQAHRRILDGKKHYAEISKPVDVTQISSHVGLPEHAALADIIERKQLPPNFKETEIDDRR